MTQLLTQLLSLLQPDRQRMTDTLAQHQGPVVLLVGHCGFDSHSLQRAAEAAAESTHVQRVNDQPTLDAALAARPEALLLVNRVLDGRFTAHDGQALIAATDAAALLVSNYPDAQADAQAAGALPGFGKSDVGTGRAASAIAAALRSAATRTRP